MNLKTLVIIIVSISSFLVLYFFNMFGAITFLVGAGVGVLIHKPVNEIFKNFQRGIYLSEKAEMEHRKKELQAELEKLKGSD